MEERVFYDNLVPLPPDVLFDEVLQAANNWGPEDGSWWSAVSSPNSPLVPTPADWMSKHKGAAIIELVQYRMHVTTEANGGIGLVSESGVGMGVYN